jgi:hypothetical protein
MPPGPLANQFNQIYARKMRSATMQANDGIDFLVQKQDWSKFEAVTHPRPTLDDGEVLFGVDRFALTANNISYALSGDMLGYWKFFPAPEGMGRIPVMGYGDVIESKHPDIHEGTRCFGFFPMSRYLRIEPGRVSASQIMDAATHRAGLAAAYNQYSPVLLDRLYDPAHEDTMALLRGLFLTSFLADDALGENDYSGATSVLISSASSKTSIALAHCVSQRDPGKPAGLVDMAGNAEVTRTIHTHWGDALKFSMSIGATHWQAGGPTGALPGPAPEFFFAPAQIAKRSAEWGPEEFQKRLGEAWHGFRTFSLGWLQIREHHGVEALREVYQEVLEGRSDPASGHIVALQGG